MPDAEFGSHRRQLGVVAGSVAAVVAVVAVVALIVHTGRQSPRSDAASTTGPVASSGSPLVSSAGELPAVSSTGPAVSAAPASSSATTTGSPTATSPAPSTSGRSSPPAVVPDSQPNFKVNLQVSPTHVVWGQPVRVTVTIVNAGGVFDRPLVMGFSGSDPSDIVSDAAPPCTIRYSSVSCPVTGVRPGRTWSFTFTFVPGVFPAMDHFDNVVYVVFDYTDANGQQHQTPQYFAHVLLSNPPTSSPPASVTASTTPSSSGSPALAVPSSATPASS